MNKNILKVVIIFCAVMLQACGTAHIQPGLTSDDIHEYTGAYILAIDITSKEQNPNSIKANKQMTAYAEGKLTELIKRNQYRLLDSNDTTDIEKLGFKLNLDIVYGSRAARYWAGFGAGKGTVKSTIEVIDSKSGEIKYSATGASDLTMGAFGGSMVAVIKQNIDKLLIGYPKTLK